MPLLATETISVARGARRVKMAQKKWRGCRFEPLLTTEVFSIMREGEASKRRRRRKENGEKN